MDPTQRLKPNRSKAKLQAGDPSFGTLSLLPEPSLPELVGAVGYDFFVIDTEHVADDGQHLVHMIRACETADVVPIVRIRHVEEKEILWTLDSGAQGLMLPLIEDAATARRAAELSYYPPEGQRTLCSASRAAAHGAYRRNFEPYLRHSNQNLLLIALIETPAAIDRIDEIAREDIDVFCVGRGDLSLKLGFPYAPQHPDVTAASERIVRAVVSAGKIASVVAYDLEDAEFWMNRGCKFIIYSQPEMILAAAYADALSQLTAWSPAQAEVAAAH